MRKALSLLLFVLMAAACWAQGPVANYSVYSTHSVNLSTMVLTRTVVVSGTTTGSCYYIGPYGQQMQIPNCSGAIHTPTICNKIGTAGTCTAGPVYAMFAQMSYQTTINTPIKTGVEYAASSVTTIACTAFGGSFGGGGVNNWFGHGSVLTKNVDPTGSAGHGCNTDGYGVTTCTWTVTPNCTNTPTWYPVGGVNDHPPALAGWWVNYDCIRAGPTFPWLCGSIDMTPLPIAEINYKTTQTTPAFCDNP